MRSPYAHARITGVDLSAAREASGVIAVFSGADFAAEQGSLPCAWPVTEDIVLPEHPAMAVDTVRYGGEIVAAVVARDRYAAADAVELIDVSYEPLEPVLDMEAALAARLAEGARGREQVVHLDAGQRRHGRGVPRRARGARAHVPAAAADPVGDGAARRGLRAGRRRVHDVDAPPRSRTCCGSCSPLSRASPSSKLRVIAPDVGGGFGSKLQVTAEEVLALLLARKLGRPVKWTESRSEGNVAVHHGRDQIQRIRIAAEPTGGSARSTSTCSRTWART